jgi:hypothetical protein
VLINFHGLSSDNYEWKKLFDAFGSHAALPQCCMDCSSTVASRRQKELLLQKNLIMSCNEKNGESMGDGGERYDLTQYFVISANGGEKANCVENFFLLTSQSSSHV